MSQGKIGTDLKGSGSCPQTAVQTQGRWGEFGVSGSAKGPGWGGQRQKERAFVHFTESCVPSVCLRLTREKC